MENGLVLGAVGRRVAVVAGVAVGDEDLLIFSHIDGLVVAVRDLRIDRAIAIIVAGEDGLVEGLVDRLRDRDGLSDVVAALVAVAVMGFGRSGGNGHDAGRDESGGGGGEKGLGEHRRGPLGSGVDRWL